MLLKQTFGSVEGGLDDAGLTSGGFHARILSPLTVMLPLRRRPDPSSLAPRKWRAPPPKSPCRSDGAHASPVVNRDIKASRPAQAVRSLGGSTLAESARVTRHVNHCSRGPHPCKPLRVCKKEKGRPREGRPDGITTRETRRRGSSLVERDPQLQYSPYRRSCSIRSNTGSTGGNCLVNHDTLTMTRGRS